jgi:hypothetical protein
VGRPSHKPIVWYKGFLYQAASWKQCHDQARLAYNGVVFEVKKEIPAKAFQELSELPDVAVSVVVKEENKDSLLGVAVKKK